MTGIFSSILQMSFYGTVAGFGVLLVGWLTDHVRAPRWMVLILWGMVALRLTVPVSVHSTISLYQFWDISEQMELFRDSIEDSSNKIFASEENIVPNKTAENGNLEDGAGSRNTKSAMATKNSKDFSATGKFGNAKSAVETKGDKIWGIVLECVSWVWLAGVLILWVYGIVSYNKLKQRLQFSIMVSEGVYETDEVSSPCVAGLFRPQIYLIPNLTRQQKEHILLHEQMHIKYLDFLWKVVSFGVISIHWFNPFLWKMYYSFQEELEKACDERVLAKLGLESRVDYGESLFALSKKKSWKNPTFVAFGESSTKKRIRRILNYRKPLMIASFLVAVFAVALCSVFLTVPKSVTEAKDIIKGIAVLPQIEARQLGAEATQAILKNKCTLVNISHQMGDGNMAYLDMDGDGMSEKIVLEPSKKFTEWRYSALDCYNLQIGEASFEGYGENVTNNLWALSLDGKTVLLVLYEDGPSGDPYTHFFRYINGRIIEIGGFAEDIQYCTISQEGVITGTLRRDIAQTDWIEVSWQLNADGQLEEIWQETYDFQVRNEVKLCEDLPLYREVGNQQTVFVVNPQMVRFLKTTADWGWVLIETADGQQGWAQIKNYRVVELDKDVMEVFEALNMAG